METLSQKEINAMLEEINSTIHKPIQTFSTTSKNFEFVVLAEGELCFVIDTEKLYIGGSNKEKICINP